MDVWISNMKTELVPVEANGKAPTGSVRAALRL